MSQQTPKKEDHANSGSGESETSNEYENFENAVKRIMRQDPKEAERIRKETPPQTPEERDS
jgi:hypothetical protein